MLKPVIVSERVGVRFIQIDLYSISDHEFQGVFLSLLWKVWQQSVTVAQYSNSFAFKFLASQLRPLEKLSLLGNKFPNCFYAHRASSSYQDTLSSLDSLLLQCESISSFLLTLNLRKLNGRGIRGTCAYSQEIIVHEFELSIQPIPEQYLVLFRKDLLKSSVNELNFLGMSPQDLNIVECRLVKVRVIDQRSRRSTNVLKVFILIYHDYLMGAP